jgi:hypothetical protein
MNLSIEIKGQWHREVWTAAETQLQDYTKQYKSDGHGIYLVLWFGHLGPRNDKNPRGLNGCVPKNLCEMKVLLAQRCANISEKTKYMIMDLSRP